MEPANGWRDKSYTHNGEQQQQQQQQCTKQPKHKQSLSESL